MNRLRKILLGIAVVLTIGLFSSGTVLASTYVHVESVRTNYTSGICRVAVGQSEEIGAVLMPANATNRNVRWVSDNPSVAAIEPDGLKATIRGVAEGTANITVTTVDGGKTATCRVEVKKYARLSSIKLNRSSLVIGLDDNPVPLERTYVRAESGPVGFRWSFASHSGVIKFEPGPEGSLYVVPQKVGTETVIVTDYAHSANATCDVTVVPGHSTVKDTLVKSLKLNQTKATLSLHEQLQLTATINPGNASNQYLEWSSSNKNVAFVDQNGLVTCVGAGNAKITVTAKDGSKKTASCTITGPKKASSVSLKASVKKVAKGDPVTITATVKPTGVIDDSVTWEPLSDNFEFVEQNARSCTIRCTGEGNLKVRAVSVNGSKKSTISITGPKKASSVSLKPDKKKLAKDEEAIIEATVNPKDAINKSVTWEPASDNFVFVEKGDTYCKIRCTDAGNIKVTAISVSNSKKKTITITGPKKGSSVSLKADKKLLPLNEQAVVTATVNPKDAIDRTVTWEPASDNAEIISYDGTTCTVKCKGEGNVKVKATSVSGNKSKTITISGPKPATSVSIKKSSYTLKVGEPVQATATVNPKNVIYNTVEWSSEDPSIATVTQDGVITAVAPGKTYIYAKAYNGKVGKCTVTVKQ